MCLLRRRLRSASCVLGPDDRDARVALAQTPGAVRPTRLACQLPGAQAGAADRRRVPEEFSPHPVETRFSLHPPIPGCTRCRCSASDPWEENVDPAYGVAESWEFLPGAARDQDQAPAGPDVQQRRADHREGRGVLDQALHDQVRRRPGRRRAARHRSQVEVIDDHNLRIDFAKGAVTFPQEFSPLVFPLYVTSEAYHSNGDISQAAVEKLPRQSAVGRALQGRGAAGAAVHHAGSRAQGPAARLSGVRAHRDPQHPGNRHAHRAVPDRSARYRGRQPRPDRSRSRRSARRSSTSPPTT